MSIKRLQDQYFSATKTVTEVIWEQKGAIGLTLSSLPILILTAALFPLNIAIQLGIQFAWIALKASFQILVNSIQLLYSAINIVRSLFSKDISLSQSAFTLFESRWCNIRCEPWRAEGAGE